MKLDSSGNFSPWIQPLYGKDAYGNDVICHNGYELVPEGSIIKMDYKPFDVYAGWLASKCEYFVENKIAAMSNGRWTAWERPIKQK